MIVASAQMQMGWTVADNLQVILSYLVKAAQEGANVLLLPECSLTGFHVRIRDALCPERMVEAYREISNVCRERHIHCFLGAPYYPSAMSQRPWNAVIHITRQGEVATVYSKRLLHGDESCVFESGSQRPVGMLNRKTVSCLFCHEVWQETCWTDFSPSVPDIVFWPSIVVNTGASHAIALATRLKCFVVQANWANHLSLPERKGFGGSVVIGPNGEVLLEAPQDTPGMFYVDIPDAQPTGSGDACQRA
jgi:predicted amidohydrolase